MDLAGGPFWTDGTFWGGAGAVIGLFSIIAIVWVTIRVGRPKRQLWCSMTPATPLLARSGLSNRLRVMYDEELLEAPHTVIVELKSRGRRIDIPSGAFDKGQPLALDVGAAILEILECDTDPDRTLPKITHEDSKLLIWPSLIKWDQNILISMLTEGRPELGPLDQRLENIDIRRGDPDAVTRDFREGVASGLSTTLAGSLVAALTGIMFGRQPRQ